MQPLGQEQLKRVGLCGSQPPQPAFRLAVSLPRAGHADHCSGLITAGPLMERFLQASAIEVTDMRKSLISCLLVSAAAFAFPACGDDDDTDDGQIGGAAGANTGGGQTTGGTSGGGGRGGTGGGGRGGTGGGTAGDAGAGVGGGATGGTDGGAGAGGTGAAGGAIDAGAGGIGVGGAEGGVGGEAGEIGIGGEAGADSGVAGAGGGDNLSDDQVIQVVRTANLGEIAQAEVALERAVDPEVRAYAQEMITDHTAANQMATALAMAEGLTPRASALSRELTQESNAIVNWLEITPLPLFDRSYMQSQVEVHAEVLRIIDEVLLPSAADPQLDEFLATMRTAVAAHLMHAQTILETLE